MCISRQSANLDQSTNRTIASDLDAVMILLSRGVAHILLSTLALNLPTATVAFPAHLAPFSIVSSVTSRSPPLLSRPIFVHQLMLGAIAMTTSSSISGSAGESCKSYFDKSLSLLESVYGPVHSETFPKPMPAGEAGLCADLTQRRYLWTDSFGVLAYTSIADQYEANKMPQKAAHYRRASDKLIETVHKCLGSPRSNEKADQMKIDASSPTGHVGLRIGKVQSKKITDYGMTYDGMYFHYVDKWLLALARAGHVDEGIRIAKSCFPAFFDYGDGSGIDGGIRWKLSVDSTAPSSLHSAGASDDTLVALIVFSILQANRSSEENSPNLKSEIQQLKNALVGYRPRVTDDPLGWGLEAMYDQFLSGQPRTRVLASIHQNALHTSHLSLPFRLYGAMIGAKLAGDAVAPSEKVDELIELALTHEENAAKRGFEEHSSINRVMLAMCLLCPGALGRRPNDPTISI